MSPPALPSQPSCRHPTSGGSVDESARRLSHQELAVAELLAKEGHQVRSVAERPGIQRSADLDVCGSPVEIKSWMSLPDRAGVEPNARSVYNKLVQAEGQSRTVVLNGEGSGLSREAVTAGMARYATRRPGSPISNVRVVGDGFDMAWSRSAGVGLGRWSGNGAERGTDRPAGPHDGRGLGL